MYGETATFLTVMFKKPWRPVSTVSIILDVILVRMLTLGRA